MIYYLFAFIIGGLVIIAPILNGQNAARLGTIRASFYNYFFATLSALMWTVLLASATFESGVGSWLSQLSSLPPHYFIGGFAGCMIILLMNYFTVRIKAFYIVILPFIGQMSMGLFLDTLNGQSIGPKKIIGIMIILLGLAIHNSRVKQTQPQ